jgi:hypothetical protein
MFEEQDSMDSFEKMFEEQAAIAKQANAKNQSLKESLQTRSKTLQEQWLPEKEPVNDFTTLGKVLLPLSSFRSSSPILAQLRTLSNLQNTLNLHTSYGLTLSAGKPKASPTPIWVWVALAAFLLYGTYFSSKLVHKS